MEELYQFIKDQDFQFKSFMAAYKFYNQYALKTNDGEYYLESMEDRVFNALFTFADGDEAIAIDIANEIIHQRCTTSYTFLLKCRSCTSVNWYHVS